MQFPPVLCYHLHLRLKLTATAPYPRTLLACVLPSIREINFYRCTVHSDIHTVHSPTDAHLLEL
jgi:hypothetical protein